MKPWPAHLPPLDTASRRRLELLAALLTIQVGRGLGTAEGPRIWERHVIDGVDLGSQLAFGERVADVGSGYGLPGLPLAVTRPDLAMTLVEPRAERARWIRYAVDVLSLGNVEVIESTWARAPRRRYQTAVARALAHPGEAVRLITSGQPVDRVLLMVSSQDTLPDAEFIPSVLDTTRAYISIVRNPQALEGSTR